MKSLIIGDRKYQLAEVISGSPDPSQCSPFVRSTLKAITDWYHAVPVFQLSTSGTTRGVGKEVSLSRDQMFTSAKLTLETLGINEGDHALLCLDPERIAGLMMIVRAMVGNLNLIVTDPAADPFQNIAGSKKLDFVALVALQAHHVFEKYQEYKQTIDHCKAILIGGSAIEGALSEKITQAKAPVYHTFGMTETASHIALRRLNGRRITEEYHTLPGIEIGVDKRSCLTVKGVVTGGNRLITNEIVQLTAKTKFRWLGRSDHIINSGGVKIFPEQIESLITTWLRKQNISNKVMLFGRPDAKFGERLCMAIEGDSMPVEKRILLKDLSELLPRYQAPKEIYLTSKFSYTPNGKLNRLETKRLIQPSKL